MSEEFVWDSADDGDTFLDDDNGSMGDNSVSLSSSPFVLPESALLDESVPHDESHRAQSTPRRLHRRALRHDTDNTGVSPHTPPLNSVSNPTRDTSYTQPYSDGSNSVLPDEGFNSPEEQVYVPQAQSSYSDDKPYNNNNNNDDDCSYTDEDTEESLYDEMPHGRSDNDSEILDSHEDTSHGLLSSGENAPDDVDTPHNGGTTTLEDSSTRDDNGDSDEYTSQVPSKLSTWWANVVSDLKGGEDSSPQVLQEKSTPHGEDTTPEKNTSHPHREGKTQKPRSRKGGKGFFGRIFSLGTFFATLRTVNRVRAFIWLIGVLSTVFVVAWGWVNTHVANDIFAETSSAVDEGSVRVESAQWVDNHVQAKVTNTSDMIAHATPVASVRTFSPQWNSPQSWIVPREVMSCSFKRVDLNPSQSQEIQSTNCTGDMSGVWARVKITITYE